LRSWTNELGVQALSGTPSSQPSDAELNETPTGLKESAGCTGGTQVGTGAGAEAVRVVVPAPLEALPLEALPSARPAGAAPHALTSAMVQSAAAQAADFAENLLMP